MGIGAAVLSGVVIFVSGRAAFVVRTAEAAEPAARVRIVVRVIAPIDNALYERTAGQISDLPAELSRVDDPSLESTTPGRLERAKQIAAESAADLVVWFEHPSLEETRVFVALPERGRILVRPVHMANSPTSNTTSAMLEASSLVVRTALLALEAGVAVGVPDEELTREAPPESPPPSPPSPPKRSKRPSPTAPVPVSRAAHPFAGIGWQLTIDGQSPGGARAGALDAGVEYAKWLALARGTLGLPSRSNDDRVSLDVSRHSVVGMIGRNVLDSGRSARLGLDVLAGAGAIFFHRQAFARSPGFVPTPPETSASFAATFEANGYWAPNVRLPLQLGVSLGADVLAHPLVFAYTTATQEIRRPTWFVQPRIAFTLTFGEPR